MDYTSGRTESCWRRRNGYHVTGSDENVYPPMSDMLREWGIEVFTPYGAGNLDRARPDLVIVGNVIRRVNALETLADVRELRPFLARVGH